MPNKPVTWKAQKTVNTVTTGTQSDPDIIQLSNGNILVSWTSSGNSGVGSPSGTDVIGQFFDPLGNKVGSEFRLNRASAGDNERDSDMAALPGGGFIVVYEDTNTRGTSIRINEFNSAGVAVSTGSTVVADSSTNSPNFRNPKIAMSTSTSVLIAYEEVVGSVINVVGKIYNPKTNTYGSQFDIIQAGTGTTNLEVTTLTNGNYVIARSDGTGDNALLYTVFDKAGVQVADLKYVIGTNTNGQNDSEVSVTALNGGSFVIAYVNTNGGDRDVEYRIYNADGVQVKAGIAGFSATSSTNNNHAPVVASFDNGSFVIVHHNDALNRMDVSHISPGGIVLGHTNFAANGKDAAVRELGDGRFAVTWNDAATGNIAMEILDTRAFIGAPVLYGTTAWTIGTKGDDVITGSLAPITIHGWTGNDTIFGGGGNDKVYGDDGNDILIGGEGIDTLTGGKGSDHYQYLAANEGKDRITSFTSADIFEFKKAAFANLALGTLKEAQFHSNSTGIAHDTTDRFIFNTVNDKLYYDSNGSAAGGTRTMIADLDNDYALTRFDIHII